MFFGTTMLMVSVVLVMAVVTTNLYSRKDSGHGPPLRMVNLVIKLYPEMMPPKEVLGDSVRKKDKKNSRGFDNGRGRYDMGVVDHVGDAESLQGCAGDRGLFSGATCCSCRHDVEYVRPDQVDMDRIDAEWRMVSRFMDRLFFWMYLILSICVQIALFRNMMPADPEN